MRRRCAVAVLVLLAGLACVEPTPQPVAPAEAPTVDAPPPTLPATSAEDIRDAVAFLADDARQGRPPGTEADAAVQAWVVERMRAANLEPGGGDGSFVVPFEVGDGVRLREGEASAFATRGASVPHSLLAWGHDTGDAPATGKLVFVGHGVAGEGEGTGDYAAIEPQRLQGAIVVALAGSDDPHAGIAARAQNKLIAARDRGAVGFVLWDPDSDLPPHNHGAFSDLEIPAVFVGKAGNEALRQALRVRGETRPKVGSRSRAGFELATPIEPVTLQTANVVGVLPGSDPAQTRRRIVVGAHMDHLGMGTASSLAPEQRAVHNGADDNASGVAVVLELAEALATVPAEHRPHDLVFVTFGAEELGLLGSKALVEGMPPEERARILAMVNFDMVGRLGAQLTVNGMGSAEELEAIVTAANADSGLDIGGQPSGWGPSDHASFYGEGIPVLHFFTGSHADYHKPTDDLDKLNLDGAATIADLAGRVILGLMDRCEPLTYVKVDRPKVGASRFKVSLGTMPDYGADVDGLALSGVREGGPAAAAGLQKGDVITRIGAREIHNIDDYMASFGELEPGVEVELEYERDGTRHTTPLIPAAPRTR